jgi:hypothetical protein
MEFNIFEQSKPGIGIVSLTRNIVYKVVMDDTMSAHFLAVNPFFVAMVKMVVANLEIGGATDGKRFVRGLSSPALSG